MLILVNMCMRSTIIMWKSGYLKPGYVRPRLSFSFSRFLKKNEMVFLKVQVNLLLLTWMKELERIFYGNVVAYDAALLPDAKPNDLQIKLWR